MRDAVEIQIGGETYAARPTFAAIMNIERKIGRSIMAMISNADQPGGVKLTEIAIVIHEAIRTAGGKLKFEEVGEAIIAAGGFVRFTQAAVEFLAGAIMAGPENTAGELPDGESKS